MNIELKPTIKENIKIREEDFGALLYDTIEDCVLQVNKIGLFIVLSCNGKSSIKDIINMIHEKYKKKPIKKIEKDVKQFI
ncbi:PqqD family peptide modification chaperone, partial [Escherichia coli]|uniref:PqqD family peptide modification chaperone n=1 Tax=Escherichia coli TaxID=562 RepID=UPI00128EBBBF